MTETEPWQALINDLQAELDQGHLTVWRIVERHRPAIQRAERGLAIPAEPGQADEGWDEHCTAAVYEPGPPGWWQRCTGPAFHDGGHIYGLREPVQADETWVDAVRHVLSEHVWYNDGKTAADQRCVCNLWHGSDWSGWRDHFVAMVAARLGPDAIRSGQADEVAGLDLDALANRLYCTVVQPDTIWWDDLTPEMQDGWRRAAVFAVGYAKGYAAEPELTAEVARLRAHEQVRNARRYIRQAMDLTEPSPEYDEWLRDGPVRVRGLLYALDAALASIPEPEQADEGLRVTYADIERAIRQSLDGVMMFATYPTGDPYPLWARRLYARLASARDTSRGAS